MARLTKVFEICVGPFITVAALTVVPLLVTLAYRGCLKNVRKEIPRCRNLLGVTSLLFLLAAWLSFAVLTVALKAGFRTDFYAAEWELSNLLVAVGGTGLALKASPRIQALIAGSDLISVWLASLSVTQPWSVADCPEGAQQNGSEDRFDCRYASGSNRRRNPSE